jgi:flagellar motor switch protein FliM
MADILSDKELDALMERVEDDPAEQEGGLGDDGDYERYDLTSGIHRIKQLTDTINQLDERIQTSFSNAMLNVLQRNITALRGNLRIEKFEAYCETLSIPSSINAFTLKGLPGRMAIVLEYGLINETVNLFFGGASRSHPIPKKDFTLIEERIISVLLKAILDSMRDSWKAFAEYELEQEDSETNPTSAKTFRQVEVLLIRPFRVEINGMFAEFHLLMPGSMVEAILSGRRELAPEDKLAQIAHKRLLNYDLQVSGIFRDAELTLDEIFRLEIGSVIPVGSPDDLEVRLNGTPKLRARLGELNNKYALLLY